MHRAFKKNSAWHFLIQAWISKMFFFLMSGKYLILYRMWSCDFSFFYLFLQKHMKSLSAIIKPFIPAWNVQNVLYCPLPKHAEVGGLAAGRGSVVLCVVWCVCMIQSRLLHSAATEPPYELWYSVPLRPRLIRKKELFHSFFSLSFFSTFFFRSILSLED